MQHSRTQTIVDLTTAAPNPGAGTSDCAASEMLFLARLNGPHFKKLVGLWGTEVFSPVRKAPSIDTTEELQSWLNLHYLVDRPGHTLTKEVVPKLCGWDQLWSSPLTWLLTVMQKP